jgi:hypothetical protein
MIDVAHRCIQGGNAGAGNIAVDPLYLDADGRDAIPGTADDDLRLAAGSPAIDAGNDALVPAGVITDLEGLPRFVDDELTPDAGAGTPPIVDMGAYEYAPRTHARGDVNCDGTIDFFDIDPFLVVLFDPAAYAQNFPACDLSNADADRNSTVDSFDIDPSLALLFMN